MRSPTRRRLAVTVTAAAVVGAILSTVAAAPAVADPNQAPTLVTDLSGNVAEALGIGIDEARSRLAEQAAAGGQVAGMAAVAGAGYAGEYFDDDGRLVV